VVRKLARIGPVAVERAELAAEDMAIVGGREEAVVARIAPEEAEAFAGGSS
jgi:hypothetical protein